MRLLLFDIDGTLVDCGGQPRPLFERALADVYGTAGGIADYDFAGKTDDQILHDVLAQAGLDRDQVACGLESAKNRYLASLDAHLDRRRMRLLPGVSETLRALADRQDLGLGLLTGNWERGARIKLGRVGLDGYFEFGAFGDGCVDRRDLPPRALDRAADHCGRAFAAADTVIIGDTTLDVACARAHGIRSLAVATGRHSAGDLAAAGADRVAENLSEARALLDGGLFGS